MSKDLFDFETEKFTARNPKSYIVVPSLPEKLKPVMEIAYNLWWVWNSDALELFRRMDRDVWETSYHNPIQMLGSISQERLQQLAEDDSFLAHLDRIHGNLSRYMKMQTWFNKEYPESKDKTFAYFSTEFGLHESLPIYSGGLGILSGDHLKSASDMGLPLVGMGLLYRFGYFKQYLNVDGWQQEDYIENHFNLLPLQRVTGSDGKQLVISIEYPESTVSARIWKVQVGRIPLYLLDTDIDLNRTEDRDITGQLYGGDKEMRIKQEIMLGIGGTRALQAMGIEPTVVHINEGHSAFLLLEKIRVEMESKHVSFAEAVALVKPSCVFTTHTPVPAGNEVFSLDLIDRYFSKYYKSLGLKKEEFLALGRISPENEKEPFCMTVIALKLTGHANGVSVLHGTISRDMWKDIWPEIPRSEIPITSITNGIHANTWISYELAGLFDRYLGSTWKDEPEDQSIWQRIEQIPDAEIWRSHERRRERLVSFARQRLKEQLLRRGASPNEVKFADEVLDPEALTIGFARRFASYKRGTLLFKDYNRIKALLGQKNRPVQLIIAGKSHPNDNLGKELIRQIIHICNDPDMRHKVVFLEDYDMNVAHYLVQGSDIWLNNPRRPLEASGTSGMKAAVNGVMNFSVLDGWWCEGYKGDTGWAIGAGEEYSDQGYQDEVESKAIYNILESDIVPMFYQRGQDGLPREWISKMKRSMMTICPIFNSNRMIEEYTRLFYMPSQNDHATMEANNGQAAKTFAAWKKTLEDSWKNVKVSEVSDDYTGDLKLGNGFTVKAKIALGNIKPDDVNVEIYFGNLDSKNRLQSAKAKKMSLVETVSNGVYVFEGKVEGDRIGHCGYVVRVLAQRDGKSLFIPGLVAWQ